MGQQRRPLWLKKERRSQPTGPNIGLGYLTDLMVWILQAKSPFRLPFWTFRPSFFFGLFFFLFFLFLALIPLFFFGKFLPNNFTSYFRYNKRFLGISIYLCAPVMVYLNSALPASAKIRVPFYALLLSELATTVLSFFNVGHFLLRA
jgi:hypothetical protein